jgi:two-component system, chemotaxis family, protein-glutamate methylesterase/glutaminase
VTARTPAEGTENLAPPLGDGMRFDVIGVAASAGGLQALSVVLGALPARLPAALVVVQHLDPHHPSLLAEILARRTRILVKPAVDGEPLQPGVIYVAPPDRHVLVNPGSLSLTHTQLVHFVRPSADLLFESLAASYGPRALAVVLTGSGSDGAMGIQAINKMGGTVLVQDEASSEFFGLPSAAIQTGCADHVLPLAEIGPALVALVTRTV